MRLISKCVLQNHFSCAPFSSFFFLSHLLSLTPAGTHTHSHTRMRNGKTTGAHKHTDINIHTHTHTVANRRACEQKQKINFSFSTSFSLFRLIPCCFLPLLLLPLSTHTQSYFLTFFLCAFARFSCSVSSSASSSSPTTLRCAVCALFFLALPFSFWPIPLRPVFACSVSVDVFVVVSFFTHHKNVKLENFWLFLGMEIFLLFYFSLL